MPRWSASFLLAIALAVGGYFPESAWPESPAAEMTHESMHGGHGAGHGSLASMSPWEGSAEGRAYSEFNHHVAGALVVLIGLAELASALRWSRFTWMPTLLPAAMTVGGLFLLVWSDHEAWPIGRLTLAETFLGGDHEILQHKTYALLLLVLGLIEWRRRRGALPHWAWRIPLPTLAVVGGLMLFLHSHGDHPAAHKIALHHAAMGTLALLAGSCKLVSARAAAAPPSESGASRWDVGWAGLVLAIGIQLLFYSE
jgi:putative copper resistance protein D